MWVLTSAYCSVTGEKLSGEEIYHMPGDRAGVPDSYCTCHEKKVLHDKPETADVD